MGRKNKSFYAVARGRTTGIFDCWEKCRPQVEGFSGNEYQGFATRAEAEQYLQRSQQEESQYTTPPNKRQCREEKVDLSTGLTSDADRVTISSSTSSETSPSSQNRKNHPSLPLMAGGDALPVEPSSPQILAVKPLEQVIQEKFDHAQATGQMIELELPARRPMMESQTPSTDNDDDDESTQVVAVKSQDEVLREKFDKAQASGKMIELMSPDRTTSAYFAPSNDNKKKPVVNPYSAARAVKPASMSQSSSRTLPTKNLLDYFSQKKPVEVESLPNSEIVKEVERMQETMQREEGYGVIRRTGDKNVRITEVLSANLSFAIKYADDKDKDAHPGDSVAVTRRMEGDIPPLGLHKRFFCGGVRVGWPYPVIMPPQRQMVNHVILALKRSLHVVLESPTGTGKSAALLCSVLAWQRYHAKCNGENAPPKIFYCSRTHSQVAQMVASLKKTPYRPRMAVLGSRERLCIHREIRPRDGSSPARFLNANLACRIRVKNTEKFRKQQLNQMESGSNSEFRYHDNDPPLHLASDGAGHIGETENDGGKKLTCPHYRQLSTMRIANLAQAELAPSQTAVSCCSSGGEKTKMGAVDIEDLVSFGVNPYIHNIAIYKEDPSESFGITLENSDSRGSQVSQVTHEGPAAREGTLKEGDQILKINGKNMRHAGADEAERSCRSSRNPLDLKILRKEGDMAEGVEEGYSEHSACPYYLSRALAKHAEIVFSPYNYLLDPGIRDALGIDLASAVVVLDESHNVEDTLRESGSGKFSELEMCQLMVMLEYQSRAGNTRRNRDGEFDLGKIAHELLVFIESIVTFMRISRKRFENDEGRSGARAAIQQWQKFRSSDDTDFEVEYFGPTGNGVGRQAVGCKPFFDRMRGEGFVESEALLRFAKELENSLAGEDVTDTERKELDLMVELVSKLSLAMRFPEHFYISCSARANGSLAFASGEDESEERGNVGKAKGIVKPHGSVPLCHHPRCRASGATIHCKVCDGSKPRWEAVLAVQLLTPSILLEPIAKECRSLIFASGSLAPLGSLCSELGLSPASDEDHSMKPVSVPVKPDDKAATQNRGKLQVKPPPLEADHVIDIEKQLRAVSIGFFPDGSPLTNTFSNYRKEGFYGKLGSALAAVVEAVPTGGVLVFFPSYSFLRNCVKAWKSRRWHRNSSDVDDNVWDRFEISKGTIVVEPTGSQAEFETAKEIYSRAIRGSGKALLLAVFRGKMSEGISFNDDNARAVICVGIPFPNAHDRSVKAKKAYNDEMRNLCGKTSLLPGAEWYTQQAYRAIAQALGRCIRHAGDYGTVILMDSRHCDDGAPGVCRAHRNLPKWMRSSVRNLSMSCPRPVSDSNPPIFNGYHGLADELKTFFVSAKQYSAKVMAQMKEDFEKAQDRENGTLQHSFDHKSGTWT